MQKFLPEIAFLKLSDARNVNFSFSESFKRVKFGYPILLFDYSSGNPVRAHISVDGYGIYIKRPYVLEQKFWYADLAGMVIGPKSSTFKIFSKNGGNLKQLGLDESDCFSVLAHLQNLDLATHSDRAKYDILSVISFYLSARSSKVSPFISLTRKDILIQKVRWKVNQMANARFLSVKELLLVLFR